MPNLPNTIILRFEKAGEKFELIVDAKLSYEYKVGVKKDLANVLVTDDIFKDANKGERQSPTNIKKTFGTDNVEEIARRMFADGELQLTTDQRRKILEEKKRKIIALIARNCIDPRSKAPHPEARIEAALEQARLHFDAFKSPEEQMKNAVEALREIIPISIENIKIAVRVPAQFAPKVYGILKEYYIQKEEWQANGDLIAVCEMPAGLQAEFYDRVNRLTSGQIETKLLK